MDIKGKIIQVLEPVSGKSKNGDWKKQEFIIETEDKFPKKVCLAIWNDKVSLGSFNVGDSVVADINVESREYNGRWFTEIKVWNLKTEGIQSSDSSAESVPMPPIPPEPEDDFLNSDDEDLPF